MFIFGLGTGRCGTVSLTSLFNCQDNVSAAHESVLCPWLFHDQSFQKNLIQMKNRSSSNNIVAEVGFYLLPYVERMIELFPVTKFICLKRDKEETIISYMRKTIRRNHWTNTSMKSELGGWQSHGIWDNCYPIYNLPKREAIGQYWEDYYQISYNLEKKYPNNFKVYNMLDILQNRDIQLKMLSFIGILKPRSVIGIKLNSIKDRGPQGRYNARIT